MDRHRRTAHLGRDHGRSSAAPLIILEFESGRVEASEEHPFWLKGAGFRAAGEIAEGMSVRRRDGSFERVSGVTRMYGLFKVHNFTVADFHTYFVGRNSILAHNADCNPLGLPEGPMSADEALDEATRLLGDDPVKIADDVFRNADETVQVRIKDVDLNDPRGPHLNIETVGPDGRELTSNHHMWINPDDL